MGGFHNGVYRSDPKKTSADPEPVEASSKQSDNSSPRILPIIFLIAICISTPLFCWYLFSWAVAAIISPVFAFALVILWIEYKGGV